MTAPPPEAISPEQSSALLAKLEKISDDDVELEDTGDEWRLLEGSDPEATVATDGDVDDFAATVAHEMRFDDDTPLPDDFDHDAPSAPSPAEVSHATPAELAHTDTQVDIAFGDPEEWSELLGEVVAAEQDADVPELTPEPEPEAEPPVLAAEDDDALERAFAEMNDLLDDAAPSASTEIGEELEQAQRTLEDTSIEEDLIAAAFETEHDDGDQLGPPVGIEPPSEAGDRMGESVVLDIDALDDEDEVSLDLDVLAANEAAPPAGDTSLLEEIEEAIEFIPEAEPVAEDEHVVPPLTEEELTINQMIDQELMSVAYEDEEGMTSTIILDGEVAKKALEEQALAEAAADGDAGEDAGDEPPKEADKPEDIGIETVVMAGDLVFDDPEEAEGGLQIEFGDERDPEIEALKAEVRERDEARAEEEATAIRVTENRRLIGGLVALTLLLAVQGLHFSRAALATMPGVGDTVIAVYDSIGMPITPDWDVTGWRFEVTKNSTDASDFALALDTDTADATFDPATEPTEPEVLTIYTRIGNRSDAALPYPLVAVSLTDRFEETMGSIVLGPGQYLPAGTVSNRFVPAGQNFDAIMSIDTPDPEATGFRLNVCYRQADRQLRCAIEDFK